MVYLMTVEQHCVSADLQTNVTDLGGVSACRMLSPSFIIAIQLRSISSCYNPVEGSRPSRPTM